MQISITQLDNVITKMKYSLLGYGSDKQDLTISVEFIQADPGKGVMVDCLQIKATAPQKEGDNVEKSMIVEVFPVSEGQSPRASKVESFTLTERY